MNTPLDPDVQWLVVWVPGTWGGGLLHEGFEKAVTDQLGADAQLLIVNYPATPDFGDSVKLGALALKELLAYLAVTKAAFQKVVVAGSSQGAWVIHEVMNDAEYAVVHRTCTYGLPALSEHQARKDDDVWDLTSPFDAVTWAWHGPDKRIVEHATQVMNGKPWHIVALLPYMVFNLPAVMGYLGLLSVHFKASRVSPHDYTPSMPLTVAWLTN